MHNVNDTTPQPQSLTTCGNQTNSPESRTLQRPRQLKQADAKFCRRIGGTPTQYGWTILTAVALFSEQLRKKTDKNSFGEFLAYLSSPIGISQFDEPASRSYTKEMPSQFQIFSTKDTFAIRWEQVDQILPWRVQLKDATDAYGYQPLIRLERIIMQTLKPRRIIPYPGLNPHLPHKQFQWFEANEVQAAEHIGRWLQWMRSKPYDKEGFLTDRWKRRIRYFTSHQHKLGLLAESSHLEVWSMFLDPTWWLQLRTNYYGMTLRQIVNSPYMLSSVRTQLRLKYDASGYGRARKSSRLRKSIRAEVETAMPQMWNVQAV
ncbi:MAG: hypothetical protein Q9180_007343, partial [Flavoplaca navasiana]